LHFPPHATRITIPINNRIVILSRRGDEGSASSLLLSLILIWFCTLKLKHPANRISVIILRAPSSVISTEAESLVTLRSGEACGCFAAALNLPADW